MTYWAEVLADNPVLFLEMQDAAGNLTDSSGNGHTGVVSGTALTYHAAGPGAGIPWAVTFAATSLATIAAHADLDLGDGPWTLEQWLRRPTAGVGGTMLTKNAAGTDGYNIYVTSGDSWRSAQGDGSSFAPTDAYSGTGWHHWVFTCTSGAGGVGSIFRDGTDLNTDTNIRTFTDSAADLVIGRAAAAMVGDYAAFAAYKSVLAEARIQAHYAAYDTAASAPARHPYTGGGFYP